MKSMTRNGRRAADERGFSIIELLIALVIIGILVSIAVVNIANRADDARLRAGQSDLVALRKAQEHASFDTGYFYRLHVLNDVPGGDGFGYDGTQPPPPATLNITDGIQDESQNQEVGNPIQIFFDLDGNFLSLTRATTVFTNQVQANETAFGWEGAYINWSREWINPGPFGNQGNNIGMPLDPWGNPYLLFTPEGFMSEPEGVFYDQTTPQLFPAFGTAVSFTPRRFDRMTLLSFGPDGVPGDGSVAGTEVGQGDDLKVQW